MKNKFLKALSVLLTLAVVLSTCLCAVSVSAATQGKDYAIYFDNTSNNNFWVTKKNEDMAFISASDETDKCDFTVFPKNYSLLQNINKNDMIKVWGSVTKRFDKYSIIVNNILKE